MIIFGMISALKIFTLTLMAVLVLVTTSAIIFEDPHESSVFASSEERPDAFAEWDKSSTFTTTGTAVARVVDQYINMDSNKIETLAVDIYTERNEDNPELKIILTETNVDSGTFEGTVFFSETDKSSGNTLQVIDGDIVSVEYTYSQVPGSDKHEDKIGVGQEKTISNSPESQVTGSTASSITERPDAYAEWGADVYSSTDIAVARVIDSFMNAEPNKIETLTASIVVADDYDNGIKIMLTETGVNTGIFEGDIQFTEIGKSSGNVIRVAEGDDVSLDYLYSEVPGSDKREDMIEIGDEITINNSQDDNSISETSVFGATVHLDKEIYSWTDKVHITVTSPFHNFDSKVVEEIGAVQPYTIRMHTSSSNINSYKLVETGPNTGIFTGEIILTGFLHDADGSGKNDHLPYEDTVPMTSGSGPADGFLENRNNDLLSVQFDYSEDVTIVDSAEIQWNTGKIQWLEASYPDSGTGVVRVTDPDMNWNPEAVDNFYIDVWSDSDAGGIDLAVSETNRNSGIFEGTVFFTTTDESSGHRLRVAEGDTITAEYEDNTLPEPYTVQDELDITETSAIEVTTDLSSGMSADASKTTLSKKYIPPSKQITDGILINEIACQNNMVLIVKYDGSPACVKSETKTKLIERGGWDNQIIQRETSLQTPSVDNTPQTLTEKNTSTNANPVQLDRDVYPIPFGTPLDFTGISDDSFTPDGRSVFPIHLTGMNGQGITGNTAGLDVGEFISRGDLVVHVMISDPNLNLSSEKIDSISENIDDLPVTGPLKISIVRSSGYDVMVLGYAGGSVNNNTENGLIDVGGNNPENTRNLGPIYETAPDSGIFAIDLPIRYTDGPADEKCPETTMYSGLFDTNLDGDTDDQTDRFDESNENPYCIMPDDYLEIKYTDISDPANTVTDSAKFELRNGVLQSDRPVHIIGSDMLLTLTEHDFNLDSKRIEEYDLDLIEWDSDAAKVTLGDADGQFSSFDPEPAVFRETGKDTGIFEVQVVTPDEIDGELLERGEEIILEYTDWSPSGADYVGDEDEDVRLTLYTSNFGATIKLDKKIYNLGDTVHFTVVSPNHNLNSDVPEEIGNTDPYAVKVSTRNSTLENYTLLETGNDTGIFTGEVTLIGPDDGQTTQGSGPTDGLLEANSDDDGITISFEFSEDETVVGSALIQTK